MENNEKYNKKPLLVFSAVDRYIEENKIDPVERELNGYQFIEWGERNYYPSFINEVYQNSPTLKAIIQSVIDYTIGDGAHSSEIILNDEKLEDLISVMAYSYAVYGGFAINVLRNRFGDIADLVPMDMRNIRTNKDNSLFYYSEYFGKRSYGRCKYVTYPKFDKENRQQFNSIFYYKNTRFQTYPSPVWSASVNSALIEYKVGEYHMNNLANGFSSNVMVCLNNGTPSDEIQEEIEENFNEKFTGSENAGRVMIAFSPDKEHAPNVEVIDTADFAEKYNSMYDYAKQQLFTSFRANPVLCGINQDNKGFSDQDFSESFKLFNRTVIRPLQKVIVNSFDKIFGKQETVSIKPFSFEEKTEEEEEVE